MKYVNRNMLDEFYKMLGFFEASRFRVIIYFDKNDKNPLLSGYVKDHLHEIQQWYFNNQQRFIVLPKENEIKSLKDFYLYCFPALNNAKDDDIWRNESLGIYDKEFTKEYSILNHLEIPEHIESGFLCVVDKWILYIAYNDAIYQKIKDSKHYSKKTHRNYFNVFIDVILRRKKEKKKETPFLVYHLKFLVNEYIDILEKEEETPEEREKNSKLLAGIYFSLASPDKEEALATWLRDIKCKIENIDDPLFLMNAMSHLTEFAKEKLVEFSFQKDYLMVTKDYKIIIEVFDNMEIRMSDLTKTVYLLFYRHPEGINIRKLSKYREELLSLYKNISGLYAYDKMVQNIDKICNIKNKEIYVHLSRIKKAFENKMESFYAHYFIVQSDQHGNPMKYIKAIHNAKEFQYAKESRKIS